MEDKKYTQARRPETAEPAALKPKRTPDGAYGFSFSIGLGLILFITGLFISLTLGIGTGIGLVFGIPLLIAGLVLPLFMMRDLFTRNELKGPCPYCGANIHTTDATIRLDCPECRKRIEVRDMKFIQAK